MTAVEFLGKQALNYLNDEQENNLIKVIKQSLEMEKLQIMKSNRDGVDMVLEGKPFLTAEQYYIETYKEDNL
jgi:hypothetical protein